MAFSYPFGLHDTRVFFLELGSQNAAMARRSLIGRDILVPTSSSTAEWAHPGTTTTGAGTARPRFISGSEVCGGRAVPAPTCFDKVVVSRCAPQSLLLDH